MKILHISTGFNLDFNGGITNYVRCIAKSQSENGHEVYVLSDGGKDDGYCVITHNPKNHAWSFVKRHDQCELDQIKSFLIDNKFDIVHIHMMLNMDQRLYQVLQDVKVKYIVSLHDYWMICPRIQMIRTGEQRCEKTGEKCTRCFSCLEKNHFLLRAMRKIFGQQFVTRFPLKSKTVYTKWRKNSDALLAGASALLPVSNRVKEIYEQSGIHGNYVVLNIGNISANDFDADYLYVPKKDINLVILSSVSELKGGLLFCKILEKVQNPKLKVHFYGRCNKKQAQMLRQHGIIDHGPYKQAELKGILASMDMGVMVPIWEDNGPQVVMEMLNNHLPVFATRMGGIPDFVSNDNGFLFDPFCEEEINAAVEFLNTLSQEKIAILKKNIHRLITPQEHYAQLMDVYEKVLNEK